MIWDENGMHPKPRPQLKSVNKMRATHRESFSLAEASKTTKTSNKSKARINESLMSSTIGLDRSPKQKKARRKLNVTSTTINQSFDLRANSE